jgi:hypothetical protein
MNSTTWKRTSIALVMVLLGCGGGHKEVEEPTRQETAAEEIRRIATTWSLTEPSKGILSPPSPVSVFHIVTRSVISLAPSGAKEELTVWEDLEMRDGSRVKCANKFSHGLGVRYGRKLGEAAVEITRPALGGLRTCEGGQHPDPEFRAAEKTARFVLRSDRLVAVEPATDGRIYIPGAE